MQDFMTLGTAPVDEPCAHVGQPDDDDNVKSQCRRFITLLRQTLGDEPLGARFAIKSFNHEFGLYYQVVCLCDTDDEEAAHDAFWCEDELPTTWEG